MNDPEIFELGLHEHHVINQTPSETIIIFRVSGGWIYIFNEVEEPSTSVFVPYNNEFSQ